MSSQLVCWVLVGLLVAGFSSIHLTDSTPGPVPATSTCHLTYRQPGDAWTTVTPYARGQNPVAYYDYFSASAHTEFVEAYVSKAYFYQNSFDGKLYFFFHHNIDNSGTPDAIVTFDFSGLPFGVAVIVSDDPGELDLGTNPEGQWEFFENTDGGVLGPFPTGTAWDFAIVASWGGPNPMQAWRFVDGSRAEASLDMSKSLEVASICNRAPTAVAGGPYSGFEGSAITFDAGQSSDPDGDALTYSWDWDGDGVFDEVTASAVAHHMWTDDFAGSVTLKVSDGEFASTSIASVTVANVPPEITVDPSPGVPIFEGATVGPSITVVDPGADAITVVWTAEGRDPVVRTYYTGTSPTSFRDDLGWKIGDDGLYTVHVSATDDDGGVDAADTGILVHNLSPTATVQATSNSVGVAFRIAGEKWHDLTVSLLDTAGVELAAGSVVRVHGSPDDQTLDLGSLNVESSSGLRAHILYTPGDDPVNGQANGANPAWLILRFTDGAEVRFHHTFNVRHVETYAWDLDLFPSVAAHGLSFVASALDRGSDDLTFVWTFGDGSTFSETVFNNGVSADPPKSPGGTFPFAASSTVPHAFATAGTYVVTVVVTDDDGGTTSVSLTITVP